MPGFFKNHLDSKDSTQTPPLTGPKGDCDKMKNALGLLLVIASASVGASRASAQPWEVGVKGGVNFTNVSLTPPDLDTRPDGRLLAGGFVGFRFHERVALDAEVLVTQLAITDDEAGVDARLEARALLVPVPLRVAIGRTDRAHLFVNGGVQWTFLGRTVETVNGVESLDEGGRDWDFGLLTGAGVRVPLSRGALSFEARYVIGLMDQDPDDDIVKIRSLFFLAGYTF